VLELRGLAGEIVKLESAKGLVHLAGAMRAPSPTKLRQVSLKITDLCHLRCPMCAQWGANGYNVGADPSALAAEEIRPAQYRRLIDRIAHLRPLYYVWGGEPFLYRGLMDVVSHIKRRGSAVAVVSSGHRVAEHAARIVGDRWDILMLSLDGDRALHDRIRGRRGTFDRLIQGIEAVLEERERQRSPYPFLMTLSTVCEANAARYDRVFETLEEVGGVDLAVHYLSWFVTEEVGRRQTELFENRLGCTPTAWRGFLGAADGIDVAGLQESMRRVMSRRWSVPFVFVPNIRLDEVQRYFDEPEETFGHDRCVAPWVTAEIMPNGDVAPCRDYPDYVCGNVKDRGLEEIFRGQRFETFRSELRREGLFPVCARCCGLLGM
jgi:radical SAM protein with 4Fe4S-binding SPASM domain